MDGALLPLSSPSRQTRGRFCCGCRAVRVLSECAVSRQRARSHKLLIQIRLVSVPCIAQGIRLTVQRRRLGHV